jgi:diacylglycerol diphosphate phosphatase/phosphatidate phosphatase
MRIQVTRRSDHWQDVTVGAVIGWSIHSLCCCDPIFNLRPGMNLAYFAYRQYYPSLADKLSHDAYKARVSPFSQDLPGNEPDRAGPHDEESTPLIDNYSDRTDSSPNLGNP